MDLNYPDMMNHIYSNNNIYMGNNMTSHDNMNYEYIIDNLDNSVASCDYDRFNDNDDINE